MLDQARLPICLRCTQRLDHTTPIPFNLFPTQKPTTYFHEIGHNLYMNHAGKWGNKGYDDMSGAMGYCCDLRCHNAPHSHQVGLVRASGPGVR